MVNSALVDLVRVVVATALGRLGVIGRLDLLKVSGEAAVVRVELTDSRRLVLKVASTDNGLVDFERTEAVTALARAAGVPVPAVLAVLAADNSGHAGRRYLLFEHVEGVSWQRIRPQLKPFQVAAAHRQLANAVLALQSIGFGSFGELDRQGRPSGLSLLEALRCRAELRVVDSRARDSFHRLLDRDAELFTGPQLPTLCHDDLHHGNFSSVTAAGAGA